MDGSANWFALRVRSNFERVTAASLSQKGYETFLPTYRCRRRRWDRSIEVEAPLFPSYLFCRFDFQRRLPILTSPGVVHIVGWGSSPTPIPEYEIDTVRAVADSQLRAEPWPFLELGNQVRIIEGPLAGLEGILIDFRGRHRLVVSISLLQRSVAAEIEGVWVRPATVTARQPLADSRRYAVAGD